MFPAKAILAWECHKGSMSSVNTSLGSSIIGTMMSHDGGPARFEDGYEVQLYDALTCKMTTTIIRSDGSFSFENLHSGEYIVNVPHTYDHPVAVSLEENESKNIGGQSFLYYPMEIGHYLSVIDKTTGKEIEVKREWRAPFPQELDSRYPVNSFGNKVLTVCEYLKMRADYPISYPAGTGAGVIIIGNLVRTPEGSWLRQSCGNPVRAGVHIWPDAIFLSDSKVFNQLS